MAQARKKLDMSLGDPRESFDFLAREAFERSMQRNHQYAIMGGDDHVKSLYEPVQRYLEARDFKSSGWCGIPNCDLLFTGGGTTQAYSMIMRHLGDDVKKENARRAEKTQIKPVILMPTPTYGMFFDQPKREEIERVHIPRDMKNGGALDPVLVVDTIEALHEDGKRIVAYYDSNPHNPLGLIRGEEETHTLAGIFNHYSEQYWQQDRSYLTVERAQPELPFDDLFGVRKSCGSPWDGPAARIRLIDDMVYAGLEYEGAAQPYSFARVDEQSQKNSFVLFGPSKAGMASVRAGLVYAGREDIRQLQHMMHEEHYFPPLYAMEAMSGYFSDEQPFQIMRDLHLKDLNAKHEFAGKFMKVLINGNREFPNITLDERNKMNRLLTVHTGMSQKQAQKRLMHGIEGIAVITSPQAGFFHMLDFSGLTGRYFDNDAIQGCSTDGFKLKSERQIGYLMNSFNVNFAAGTWAGLDEQQMMKRVTFALPPEDIIDFVGRLEDMTALLMTEEQVVANNYELKRAL